ncbi:unnamed protein product [Boreogadus saida]
MSSGHSTEGNPMGTVIRTALARLGLDAPQADVAQPSAFFRRSPATAPFSVPPSEEYLKELHVCWKDAKALPHPSSSARALAAMRDPEQYGLGRMPRVEPAIASLILTPDQALRPDARCPRPQCRVTDDLLSKAYDAAARMGRIGNSLSHLMLALSTAAVEPSMQDQSDASLQAFALISRESGRVMSTLVQTRRQVWLSQSPLTEACRKALRAVPVVPGELFGSAALETLERAAQARQTNLQLSGLHRSVSAPGRPRAPPAAPRGRSQLYSPSGVTRVTCDLVGIDISGDHARVQSREDGLLGPRTLQIPGPSGAGAQGAFNWREKPFFLTPQRPPTSEADQDPGIAASLEDATEEDATEEGAEIAPSLEDAEIAASLEDAAEDNAEIAASHGGFAAAETGQSTRTEQRQA